MNKLQLAPHAAALGEGGKDRQDQMPATLKAVSICSYCRFPCYFLGYLMMSSLEMLTAWDCALRISWVLTEASKEGLEDLPGCGHSIDGT